MLWTSYLHALSEVDVHVPALACIRIYNLVASRSGLLIWCARVAACPRLLVVGLVVALILLDASLSQHRQYSFLLLILLIRLMRRFLFVVIE